MKHPQDVDALPTNAVRHQIRCTRNHQFTRSRYAACSAEGRVVCQHGYRVLDLYDQTHSGLSIVLRDVVRLLSQVP